jgi:hypothetical protein
MPSDEGLSRLPFAENQMSCWQHAVHSQLRGKIHVLLGRSGRGWTLPHPCCTHGWSRIAICAHRLLFPTASTDPRGQNQNYPSCRDTSVTASLFWVYVSHRSAGTYRLRAHSRSAARYVQKCLILPNEEEKQDIIANTSSSDTNPCSPLHEHAFKLRVLWLLSALLSVLSSRMKIRNTWVWRMRIL